MDVFDENYIELQRKKLINIYLSIIGFKSLESRQFIKYNKIQNEENKEKIIKLLPALRTVFQTHEVRSLTNRRNDKHIVLNLLRQLLKTQGYKLESKTFHLRKNGKLTSSCKYIIVPMNINLVESVPSIQDIIVNSDEL